MSTLRACDRPWHADSVHIGTAGWSVPGQHADLFPGEGSHLARYSRVLRCAEINSSFYRPHRPATYARWAASTPEDFRFSVKAPKTITHECNLAPDPALLAAFLDEVRGLGSKLGPVLLQIPPRQSFDEFRARAFLALFRELYPTGSAALEPRHLTWFSPEAERLMEKFHVARVAADPPLTAEGLRPGGYAGLRYHRLHGSPRMYFSNYSVVFVETLAAHIAGRPPDCDLWCIFDNTGAGAAIKNALSLARILSV